MQRTSVMKSQLTLRGMFVSLSLLALGFVSLAYSSQVWLSLLATGTTVLFLLLGLGSLLLRERQRAFCTGFSLWGLAYLGLVGVALEQENGRGTLMTTQSLKALHSAIARPVPQSSFPGLVLEEPNVRFFMPSGQLIWSWLLGLAGGYTGMWFYGRVQNLRATEDSRGP
jgi:hypothetical protein